MDSNEKKEKRIVVTMSGKQYSLGNNFDGVFSNQNYSEKASDSKFADLPDLSNIFESPSKSPNMPLVSPSILNLQSMAFPLPQMEGRTNKQKERKWSIDSLTLEPENKDIKECLAKESNEKDPASKNSKRRLESSKFDLKNENPLDEFVSLAESPQNTIESQAHSGSRELKSKQSDVPFFLSQNLFSKLQNLYAVLIESFIDGLITQRGYSNLTPLEEKLFHPLLERKFQFSINRLDFDSDPARHVALADHTHKNRPHKRPEEGYKFVLTRVIKFLRKKLHHFHPTVKDPNALFYEVYFGAVAKDMGLPLCEFYYPLTKSKGQMKLNSKYFLLLLKSELFYSEMANYITGKYAFDRKAEICKKFKSLLLKWDELLCRQTGQTHMVEAEIVEYLKSNKRCKLPWTFHEAQEAAQKFMAMIANLQQCHKS